MTINVNTSRNEYTATSGQTVFNFTFKIYTATDLNVYVTPAGQECNDVTDLTEAYTVTGVGLEDGGSITLNTGAGANDLVTIASAIPTSRTTDYQSNGDFTPETVNNDIDRAISLIKQVESKADRSLLSSECLQGPKPLTLPRPASGEFVRWKTDLSGLENVSGDDIANGIIVETDYVRVFDTGYVKVFDTVAEMVADTSLFVGQTVRTKGYNSAGDGGGNEYEIVASATGTDDGGSFIDLNTHQAKGLFISGSINSAQFGADNTGATNATPSLHAMFDHMVASGMTGYLNNGTYLQGFGLSSVVASDTNTYFPAAFDFNNITGFTLYGYGATITADPTMPDNEFNRGFYFLNSTNIHIEGVTYDGRLDSRTPFGGGLFNGGDPLLSNRKHGFGFYGCNYISLINCKSTRTMMDGLFIGRATTAEGGASSRHGQITNLNSLSNYRQGASIVSGSHINIDGGDYSNTGGLGAGKGTPPMAGIDIEADAGQPDNVAITIRGARLHSNNTGIAFSVNARGCKAISCDIQDSASYAVLFSDTAANNTVDSCYMTQLNTSSESEQYIVIDAGVNNTVQNSYMEVAANNDGYSPVATSKGATFKNNELLDSAAIGVDTTKKLLIIDGLALFPRIIGNKLRNAAASSGKFALENISPTAIIKDNDLTSVHGDSGAWGMAIRAGQLVSGNFVDGHKTTLGKQIHVSLTGALDQYVNNFDTQNPINGFGFRSSKVVAAHVYSAAGSPEGVLAAAVGSLYMRTDGGAATTLYVKETGTGNTGWIAK